MGETNIDMREYEYVRVDDDEPEFLLLKKTGEESYVYVHNSKDTRDFYGLVEAPIITVFRPDDQLPGNNKCQRNALKEGDKSELNEPGGSMSFPSGNEFPETDIHLGTGTYDILQPSQPEGHLRFEAVEKQLEENFSSTFRWNKECVLCFLTLYEDKQYLLHNGKTSRKKFFENIADEMTSQGYEVSGCQCKTKLESLKRQYKNIKDHNNKSGNNRRDWQFLERMDEIFGKKPWVEPLSTASSSESVGNCKSKELLHQGESSKGGNQCNTRNKRIVDLLSRMRESKEKQHEERMKQRGEALQILHTLVQTLTFRNKE